MSYDMMAPDGHTFYHCLGSVSSWLLRHDFHHLLLQMLSTRPNTGLDGNGPIKLPRRNWPRHSCPNLRPCHGTCKTFELRPLKSSQLMARPSQSFALSPLVHPLHLSHLIKVSAKENSWKLWQTGKTPWLQGLLCGFFIHAPTGTPFCCRLWPWQSSFGSPMSSNCSAELATLDAVTWFPAQDQMGVDVANSLCKKGRLVLNPALAPTIYVSKQWPAHQTLLHNSLGKHALYFIWITHNQRLPAV